MQDVVGTHSASSSRRFRSAGIVSCSIRSGSALSSSARSAASAAFSASYARPFPSRLPISLAPNTRPCPSRRPASVAPAAPRLGLLGWKPLLLQPLGLGLLCREPLPFGLGLLGCEPLLLDPPPSSAALPKSSRARPRRSSPRPQPPAVVFGGGGRRLGRKNRAGSSVPFGRVSRPAPRGVFLVVCGRRGSRAARERETSVPSLLRSRATRGKMERERADGSCPRARQIMT